MTAQNELSLPLHKFSTESPTRWGSHLKMMERVLEQEKAITQVPGRGQKDTALCTYLARHPGLGISHSSTEATPGLYRCPVRRSVCERVLF